MKQIVATLLILVCASTTASAQYTEHLQQNKQGQGTVTVTQSKEIDDLVNGKQNKPATTSTPRPATSTSTPRTSTTTTPSTPRTSTTATPSTPRTSASSSASSSATTEHRSSPTTSERDERATRSEATQRTTPTPAAEPAGRKVMRGAKRTTGYRVQVYSGGSKREDRVKAEQTANRMKSAFPEQPIYTHFYSPRWVCRMGNFKTYEEAMAICRKVRAMGYKQASVVKGSISVAR